MLGVLIGFCFVSYYSFFINNFRVWSFVSVSCLFLTLVSLLKYSSGRVVLRFFYLDSVSYPLLVLSSLVVFLSVLARYNICSGGVGVGAFLFTISLVGISLYFCFMVKTYIGYFIFFESSIIPLLFLITR